MSLKCYTKEAVTLAYAELQNVVLFLYQKKMEVSSCAMFEMQTVPHYIKGFLCFILWLLMYAVVLTKLEMLILTSCSGGSQVKRCKAQA